jgi:hypothetical protein
MKSSGLLYFEKMFQNLWRHLDSDNAPLCQRLVRISSGMLVFFLFNLKHKKQKIINKYDETMNDLLCRFSIMHV